MRPIMMQKLLSMLTVDLPALTENTVISLRMLTHHYERCTTYYSSGHPDHGVAGDEEKKLTMILFTRLFDALAHRSYEPELFSRALPCLAAIGCALSPDCSVTGNNDDLPSPSGDDAYIPRPTETKKVQLPPNIGPTLDRFAEHYHDVWCAQMVNILEVTLTLSSILRITFTISSILRVALTLSSILRVTLTLSSILGVTFT